MGAPAPAAFPQNAQYKKNFKKNDDEDEEHAEVPAKTKKKPKTTKKNMRKVPAQAKLASKAPKETNQEFVAATATEEYSAHRYSELRKQFINNLKDQGVPYKSAANQWNSSALKKQLLAPVDLPELKRRRFVTKDCTENPWAS